jgi:antiviral helicase SKI2
VEAAAATPALAEARETVIALTRQAGKVQQECGLDILPDEFARGVLKWGLMEVWLFSI